MYPATRRPPLAIFATLLFIGFGLFLRFGGLQMLLQEGGADWLKPGGGGFGGFGGIGAFGGASLESAEWQPFTSPEGRFTVLFPGSPYSRMAPIFVPITMYELAFPASGVEMAVGYGDILAYPPMTTDQRFANARAGMMAKVPNGSVEQETVIALDGYPGREVRFANTDGMHGIARMYLYGKRFYVLVVITNAQTSASFDPMLFLDSFKVEGGPGDARPQVINLTPSVPPPPPQGTTSTRAPKPPTDAAAGKQAESAQVCTLTCGLIVRSGTTLTVNLRTEFESVPTLVPLYYTVVAVAPDEHRYTTVVKSAEVHDRGGCQANFHLRDTDPGPFQVHLEALNNPKSRQVISNTVTTAR